MRHEKQNYDATTRRWLDDTQADIRSELRESMVFSKARRLVYGFTCAALREEQD